MKIISFRIYYYNNLQQRMQEISKTPIQVGKLHIFAYNHRHLGCVCVCLWVAREHLLLGHHLWCFCFIDFRRPMRGSYMYIHAELYMYMCIFMVFGNNGCGNAIIVHMLRHIIFDLCVGVV